MLRRWCKPAQARLLDSSHMEPAELAWVEVTLAQVFPEVQHVPHSIACQYRCVLKVMGKQAVQVPNKWPPLSFTHLPASHRPDDGLIHSRCCLC